VRVHQINFGPYMIMVNACPSFARTVLYSGAAEVQGGPHSTPFVQLQCVGPARGWARPVWTVSRTSGARVVDSMDDPLLRRQGACTTGQVGRP